MKARPILIAHLALMGLLLGYGLLFPASLTAFLERPGLYLHAKLVHIVCVTLFFANTVIGTIWETRGLRTENPDIIRHTYRTVLWLDGVFTAPLVLLGVLSGIMLGTILGGIWTMGWLSAAFVLFLLSGAVWLVGDLPNQHRVNQLFETVAPGAERLPQELTHLLRRRMLINFLGFAPLLIIFYLMIQKPDLPRFGTWFRRGPSVSQAERDVSGRFP